MNGFFRSAALVAFGFVLLVVQSTITAVFPLHPFSPNLLLPVVIFLGVSPDVHIVRGVVISFLLGYLLDIFSGNPMSLATFLLVAMFLVARGAGLRLFLRGPAFQVALTFVATLVAGGASYALRAIFERPAPFPVDAPFTTALALFGPAIATALAAPLVFAAVQRIDALSTTRREDAGASV
jgi:rod shape-determining protein MreD